MSHVSRVLDLLQAHPLHQMMGVSALQAQDGRASLEVEVTPERVNAVGMFHGGILYVISDLACLAALLTRLDEGVTAATHDLHVSIMRAARLGDRVRVEARVIRQGRSIAFVEALAYAGDELLGRATATKTILRARS